MRQRRRQRFKKSDSRKGTWREKFHGSTNVSCWGPLCRTGPVARLTGVLAFEYALSSLTSAIVHSRRTALRFFFGFVTFNLLAPYFDGACVLTYRRAETTKQNLKIVRYFLRVIPTRRRSLESLTHRPGIREHYRHRTDMP